MVRCDRSGSARAPAALRRRVTPARVAVSHPGSMVPLVHRVGDAQIEAIVGQLCAYVSHEQEPLRDAGSVALKMVIAEVPVGTMAAVVLCQRLGPWLLSAISTATDHQVRVGVLDVLCDMLSRFGALLQQHHAATQQMLLDHMLSSSSAVRKRATQALSVLAGIESDVLFGQLMSHLLASLASTDSDVVQVRALVQLLLFISRHAGHRLGKYLPDLIPMVLAHVERPKDDETSEGCLHALESFVLRSPTCVVPFLPRGALSVAARATAPATTSLTTLARRHAAVIGVSLHLMTHDPNYTYDDAEDADSMEQDDDEDEDADEDFGCDACVHAIFRLRHRGSLPAQRHLRGR